MLIKKENKNQITCRISKEELTARGIDSMEELMHDQVQARKFLNEILDEARENVDFSVDSGPINVQMAGQPDGSVSIKIFTDKQSAVRSMIERYKGLVDFAEKEAESPDKDDEKDPYEGVEVDTIVPNFKGKQNVSLLPVDEVTSIITSLPEDASVMLPIAISFENLEDVITLSRQIVSTNKYADSDLYRMDDRYYLTAELTDTKKTLGNSIFALAEFSGRVENHGDVKALLREHGELIREHDAIKVLSDI